LYCPAAHTEQEVLPIDEARLLVHAVQAAFPELLLKVCRWHIAHVTQSAPVNPGLQVQAKFVVLPTDELLLTGQPEQTLLPRKLLCLPAVQATHGPPLGPVYPALHRQLANSVLLAALVLAPCGQAIHVLAFKAPNAAEYVCITTGNTFVRTSSHDSVFFLQQQWTHLQHIIHNDSIVLAIVYRNKHEKLVMGIYDILRASGVEYDGYNIFDRQKHLFSLFAQQTPDNFCESITAHWVGEEGSLVQYMRDSSFLHTLPFEIDNMLRINQATGKHLQYTLLLRPLLIPSSIDMHDTCALRPCNDL